MKASSAAASGACVDLADFGERAEMILSEARAKASRLLADARGECELLTESAAELARDKGEREGFQAGLERGRKEGRELAHREKCDEIAALASGLGEALSRFESRRVALESLARDDLLDLAIRLSERITRRRLAIEPGLVAQQVEGAIEAVSRGSRLTVALHPDDAMLVRELAGEWSERVEIEEDGTIERGGCLVRNERGVVADATVSTQLERIAQAILPGSSDAAPGVAA